MAKYIISDKVKKGSRVRGLLGGKYIDKELHKLTTKELKLYIAGASQQTIDRLFILEETKETKGNGKETETPKTGDSIQQNRK